MERSRSTARSFLGALVLCGFAAAPVAAADYPTVVELFTSQGCSACPPADAYLLELLDRQDAEDLIVLGFHVDYWDYLGWADTFGGPEMTERQHSYVQSMNLRSVYTPQMIVGGRYDVIGVDRDAVEQFLLAEKAGALPRPSEVWLDMQEDGLYLKVEGGKFEGVADVWLVIFGAREEVEILRGENAGQTIVYGNVVHSVERLGEWTGKYADFSVPEVMCDRDNSGLGCVALVQMQGHGAILGAAQISISLAAH